MTATDEYVGVRYLVADVGKAVDFYTAHLGFTVNLNAVPAFADVLRGRLRLLLSGPASSGARANEDAEPYVNETGHSVPYSTPARTMKAAARATSGVWKAPETRSLIARRAPSRSASSHASSTETVSPEMTSCPGQL